MEAGAYLGNQSEVEPDAAANLCKTAFIGDAGRRHGTKTTAVAS